MPLNPSRARSWLGIAGAIAATAVVLRFATTDAAVSNGDTVGAMAQPFAAQPQPNAHQPPDGKDVYATTCAACHQLDGSGLTDVYPPLAESEWVTGDEERLIKVVLHGLTGEIEVGGELYSGAMPAWGPSLNDAQVAAVLTYVRKSWGNAAPAVTPATVARVRRATAARAVPWTAKDFPDRTPPPAELAHPGRG